MKPIGTERIRGMLGLAMRAGKLVVGTEMICRAMPKGAAQLVVISCGASDGTKRKLSYKCEFYSIDIVEVDIDTEELGRLLGKTYTPAAVAVTDCGIAEQIKEAYYASKQ